jgi:transcriptional regulator with XRE-family HTH domain
MPKPETGPDPIDVAVGERLRIRRRWMGLSQTHLAQALGLTFQQIQKYEKGKNRVSASMLVKAAAALETSVAYLVDEDGLSGLRGDEPHSSRLVDVIEREDGRAPLGPRRRK